MSDKKAKLGVLGLMMEGYEPIFPGVLEAQKQFLDGVLATCKETAEFVFPRVAGTREDIEAIVEQYNHDGLDGILIVALAYSPGQYLVRAMQNNRLQLAMVLIQPADTVKAEFTTWDHTVNQGIHGAQDNANCLRRAGIPCAYFAGEWRKPAFISSILPNLFSPIHLMIFCIAG